MKNPICSNVLVISSAAVVIVLLTSCSNPSHQVRDESPGLRSDPLERTAQPVTTLPATLSPQMSDVVKLTRTGISEQVLLAYVERAAGPFHANAEQLITLRDAGVPPRVIEAMLRHPANQRLLVRQIETTVVPAVVESSQVIEVEVTNVVVMPPAPVIVQQPAIVITTPTPVTVVAPPTPVEYREVLDPYGSWIEVPSHGWCWQPTLARTDRNWQPYHSGGRWIYTNHGWYWLSDYRWGHVPFHYGRWTRSARHGWLWVPGTHWGPAWVSWRYGHKHVGWAPLPPHAHYHPRSGFHFLGKHVSVRFEFGLGYDDYTFCPIGSFYSSSPYRHYLGHHHNVTIYNQTTVVNNYNTQTGTAGAPANNGVPVDTVQRAARTVVEKVRVLDVNPVAGRSLVQPGRLVRSNGTLAVFRQPVRKAAAVPSTSGDSSRRATPVTAVREAPAASTGTATRSVSIPARSGGRTVISKTRTRSEPVKSRVIFVDQVPLVRRSNTPQYSYTPPISRPSRPSRSNALSARSSRPRAPAQAPEPASAPTPAQAPRVTSPSRSVSPKRAAPTRSVIRSTPTPAPRVVRTPVSKPVVTTPTRVIQSKPAAPTPRITPQPAPPRKVATPKPVARPAAPPSRPKVVAAPAPAPVRRAPAPARTPVSNSSKSSASSSGDSSSDKPSSRPARRPQRKN